MSTRFPTTIACPQCGRKVFGMIAICLNLGRSPDFEAQILDGRLNRVTCTCGFDIEVVRTVAIVDFRRKWWVICYPEWAEVHWPELAKTVRLSFFVNAIKAMPPPMRTDTVDWKIRLVFGYRSLQEKLALWNAGLSEVEMETTKLRIIAVHPEWAPEHIRWIGTRDECDRWTVGDRIFETQIPRGLPPLEAYPSVAISQGSFWSYRRFLVNTQMADPLLFDLECRGDPWREYNLTRTGDVPE